MRRPGTKRLPAKRRAILASGLSLLRGFAGLHTSCSHQSKTAAHGLTTDQMFPTKADTYEKPTHHAIQIAVGARFRVGICSPMIPATTTSASAETARSRATKPAFRARRNCGVAADRDRAAPGLRRMHSSGRRWRRSGRTTAPWTPRRRSKAPGEAEGRSADRSRAHMQVSRRIPISWPKRRSAAAKAIGVAKVATRGLSPVLVGHRTHPRGCCFLGYRG